MLNIAQLVRHRVQSRLGSSHGDCGGLCKRPMRRRSAGGSLSSRELDLHSKYHKMRTIRKYYWKTQRPRKARKNEMVLAQNARMCGFCCAVPPKRNKGNSVAFTVSAFAEAEKSKTKLLMIETSVAVSANWGVFLVGVLTIGLYGIHIRALDFWTLSIWSSEPPCCSHPPCTCNPCWEQWQRPGNV